MGKSNEDSNQQLHDVSSKCLGCVSCTTFNILAPIYKRLDGENRESDFREIWVSRNESILDRLLCLKSSLICLQEFWVGNEEFVSMYEKPLQDAGYAIYKLARTNNRGDGTLSKFCVFLLVYAMLLLFFSLCVLCGLRVRHSIN